jgi:hypothetical protein
VLIAVTFVALWGLAGGRHNRFRPLLLIALGVLLLAICAVLLIYQPFGLYPTLSAALFV